MPSFEIYKSGKKVGTKTFQASFYIVEDLNKGTLRWEADEEQGSSGEGGVIHVWIQTAFSPTCVSRQIACVRPDWLLVVNGVELERKLHLQVEVGGKLVELKYKDYEFVGSAL